MKQSGRISLLGILSLGCVVVVVAMVFLFSRESPASAATKFMVALESHDVDTLTKMTMMNGASEENIHKQWDFCVNTAERYYRFVWHIEGSAQASPNTASVKIRMIRDADHPGSYDELEELPLVKVGDNWKVDVRALSKEFFSSLPR